ncbi:ATP-binding protein [Kitasatospora sp. MAP5-34]|uniref:ATP-binding protein n=1 Tax=Kitasatospora sp. MAP5-34 TaxID=3035102 RepID=UPI002475E0AE|nr:ATP-binding protein [Kitasatospora sp. MAP5-34]MDH6579826.1 serine/threonine-protein kinase RsbW [Kitasatospora sp. MAP5-34]
MPETLDRPPAVAGEHACWLPRHRKSAGAARRLLRDFLADMVGGELFAEVGELLLSELVAKAVVHARTPPGRLIRVRFEFGSGQLRIEVHDASNVRPVVRPAGGDDECGRGLLLVRELATGWGCCPRAGGVGKAMWCTLGPAGAAAGCPV